MELSFKELVLKNAKEIFIKYGYAKTSMNDIALACHKSKGLIYHHFKGKDEILKIIVQNEMDMILEKMNNDLLYINNVKDKLRQFIILFLKFADDKTNLYHKLFIEINDFYFQIKDSCISLINTINVFLKDMIIEGQKENIFIPMGNDEILNFMMLNLFSYIKPPFIEINEKPINNPKIESVAELIINSISI